jgi:hypothetical protein
MVQEWDVELASDHDNGGYGPVAQGVNLERKSNTQIDQSVELLFVCLICEGFTPVGLESGPDMS